MSLNLKRCGEQIAANVASIFNQVEFYEGQFERFDEAVVSPPACYIEYTSGEASEVDEILGNIDFVLYLITSKLDRDPGSMLEVLEDVIEALHKKPVQDVDENDQVIGYIGKIFYKGFRVVTTYPGLLVWEAYFRVER